MRKTFSTTEQLNVFVELGAGRLSATGADVEEVVVEIRGPRAEEFAVELNGKALAVVGPRGRFFGLGDSHDVQLLVPAGSDLTTKTGSADTAATGTLGMLYLKTGSGDITFDRADGIVVIESGSGDIRGRELGAEVRIKSGSGDIELGEVRGKAGISTGSGDVVIADALATTVVKTGSGDLEVRRSTADVTLTTASGDLTLGHVPQGKVVAKNVSGDVRVGIPSGTPVWTDINSVTGKVASNLAGTGKPADGQPYVELRATTVSGDVYLQQV
jgi:DUF4097 and DUF4098 domain-containing protein YvlB